MTGPPLSGATPAASLAHMLEGVAPLGATAETVPLALALGRTLYADIRAERDAPPFASSAMDGYALAAGPARTLRLVGVSAAGAGFDRPLSAGEAVRIYTGAPLPEGAEAVAIQEEAIVTDGGIAAPATTAGQNVRPRAQDLTAGRVVLPTGATLDAIALSLAAAAGAAKLAVWARPRVALLSTGDEIVPPGTRPIGPYQIYESITPGLAALIEGWGGVAHRLSPATDDPETLARAAQTALEGADLLVTVGGASVGDRDLVKPALRTLGLSLCVETVAMRPGKPLWFGRIGTAYVLGLPGNPASALVCAHLFLRPLLKRLLGETAAPKIPFLTARLTSELPGNGPRAHFLRARTELAPDATFHVTPFEAQDSSLLSVFGAANALIHRAAHAPPAIAGELVEVLALGRA
jgi:molybdopterin molybdotransferase